MLSKHLLHRSASVSGPTERPDLLPVWSAYTALTGSSEISHIFLTTVYEEEFQLTLLLKQHSALRRVLFWENLDCFVFNNQYVCNHTLLLTRSVSSENSDLFSCLSLSLSTTSFSIFGASQAASGALNNPTIESDYQVRLQRVTLCEYFSWFTWSLLE